MKKVKKIFRFLLLLVFVLLALSGVFFAISPRRPDQEYDNEIKTELVEGQDDDIELNNRN